ncbi:hypothetical protein ACE1CA_16685 [Aerosakkonemataceae cyanobacterium BLCC-F167]|uniref:Uncharacterized protein n=1 Tax=Floridaenema evergladense BLCC-F167 TaxID=3153639 RepID=A0ABV4WML4_9CYAN
MEKLNYRELVKKIIQAHASEQSESGTNQGYIWQYKFCQHLSLFRLELF